MSRALLPPWHGPAEAALADVTALAPLPVPIASLWDPALCPGALLPWLAWTLDAADFDPEAPEEIRRRVVAEAILVHRQRGTRAGVRRALAAVGLGDAALIERYGVNVLDGTRALGGGWTLEPADHWAEFRVVLERPMSIAQAEQARAVITRAAPARSHLRSLDFRQAALILDGSWTLNGTYALGET